VPTVVGSVRRHRLLKWKAALALGDDELAAVWHAKFLATPAVTLLPVGFPSLVTLGAGGYVALDDVTGADADELVANAGLTRTQANAVVAATAALLAP
jgi:hypothetical protein